MKWDVIASAIISGVAVSLFGFFFLSERAPNTYLSLEYNSAEIETDYFYSIASELRSRVETALKPTSPDQKLPAVIADRFSDYRLLSFEDFSFRAVENIKVKNLSLSDEASIRIVGTGEGIVRYTTKLGGSKDFSGRFEDLVKLQPDESVFIINYTDDGSSIGYFYESSEVLVYGSQGLIKPEFQPTIINYMFGSLFTNYPAVFFLLIMSGGIAWTAMLWVFFQNIFLTPKTTNQEIETEGHTSSNIKGKADKAKDEKET